MIPDVDKRSWVEVDLDVIINNYRIYKSHMPNDAQIMAVVKADAYGHGDIEVASCLNNEGVRLFAVSNIKEAIRLRNKGINGEILILGYTPLRSAKLLKEYDITQALLDDNYADILKDYAESNTKVQFAIDTGMNRIGLDADDVAKCEKIIRKNSNRFNLNGLFTHLCVADDFSDESIKFTKQQINKFKQVTESIADLELPYIHCLNSAGGLYTDCQYEGINRIVRLGIVLYGLKPDRSNTLPEGIRPALQWKSVVSMIKTVHTGESIGYGRSYKATHDMIIATIPTGYADGYNRLLSNKGYVLINGAKAPIVGRICMDQFMIDVSNIGEVHIGNEVVLLGSQGDISFDADDMAELIDTIGYEIVCDISKRVPRFYSNL